LNDIKRNIEFLHQSQKGPLANWDGHVQPPQTTR